MLECHSLRINEKKNEIGYYNSKIHSKARKIAQKGKDSDLISKLRMIMSVQRSIKIKVIIMKL